jgi:hypothetical protein
MSEPHAHADKTALLARLLLEHSPMCAACIASKSDLPVADVEPALTRIQRTLFVKSGAGRCSVCAESTSVYSLFAKD